MANDEEKLHYLVMDDRDCSKSDVLAAIVGSATFGRLHQEWRSVAMQLGLPDYKIEQLADEYVIKVRVKTLPQLVVELLNIWKAEKGDQARVVELCKAFEKASLPDIAQELSAKFNVEYPRDVPKYIWHGKLVTVDQLLPKEECEKKEKRKVSPPPGIPIIRPELNPPSQPKYYIPRTMFFIASTELDSAIFTSDKSGEHIFLFKDITKPELAKLIRYKFPIEISGDQLNNVTVRFILLECDEDFDWICKHTPKAGHMIQRKQERHLWVKSSRNSDLIRQFIKEPPVDICEGDLAQRIHALPPPFSLSIADSPGMGKTLVLANLATRIQENGSSNDIHLFIVLHEIMQQIQTLDSSSSALETVAAYSSTDQVTHKLLSRMMRDSQYQVYLFLDGYDEVLQDEKLDLVDVFLKYVQELQNFKVIVTTRPHLRTRLEVIFNQFSYEIHSFNESNQIAFLTSYWIHQHGAENCEVLDQFTRQCLSALQNNLSDGEREIAGIPLQCMMVGEVYAEHAKRACRLKYIRPNTIASLSFIQMYQKLIELKFSKISNTSTRQNYLRAHVHEAMKLLFPDWIGVCQPICDRFNEATMYSIGLVEKGPNTWRFVHRTFAEYLLAEFVADNLGKYGGSTELLFGKILGREGGIQKSFKHEDLLIYDLRYPVIGYFIDMHLKQLSIDELILSNYPTFTKFNVEDVCVTVRACCSNELESTLDYATKLLSRHRYQFCIGEQLRDRYFKNLPHLIVLQCKDVSVLEKVLDFTKDCFQVDLSYHAEEDYCLCGIVLCIPHCTPLHFAVHEGKCNMAMWFVQKCGDEVSKLEYLLHACVGWSLEDSDSLVEDKLVIIDMLVGCHSGWIEERDSDDCTPMLQNNVHLTLLQRLLFHGADTYQRVFQ